MDRFPAIPRGFLIAMAGWMCMARPTAAQVTTADSVRARVTARVNAASRALDAGDLWSSARQVDTMTALVGTATPEQRRALVSTSLGIYFSLARAYAARERDDSALAVLNQGIKAFDGVPGTAGLAQQASQYAIRGNPAPDITAEHWLNAPAGTTVYSTKGRVSLIEFSAHWCGPCKASYPAIIRLSAYGNALCHRVNRVEHFKRSAIRAVMEVIERGRSR